MRGHIRERPEDSGNWYAILDLRDPTTGKRRRKWHSLEATGKRQAQIECARLISEINGGTYLSRSRPRSPQLSRSLARAHARRRFRHEAHERYAEIARKNVVPLIGAMRAHETAAEQDLAGLRARRSSAAAGMAGAAYRPHGPPHAPDPARRRCSRPYAGNYSPAIRPTRSKPPKVERKQMQPSMPTPPRQLIEAARANAGCSSRSCSASSAVSGAARSPRCAGSRSISTRPARRGRRAPSRPKPGSGRRKPRAGKAARSPCRAC